jgi:RND family efflux transporter MFP subunit
MKKISLLLVFIVVISCSKKSEKIFPVKRNMTESVYSSLTVQPDSLYQAYAIVAGILENNLVEEGDHVSKGDPLIQINNNTPKINTQNAKLSLELAQENYKGSSTMLRTINDEIAAAKLKYYNDSINYYRQKNLWDQNIGSKVTYDSKKLNYQLSSNSLQLLKSRYNRTENELRVAVQQALNAYRTSLINTKDFTVKSAIDGKVFALYKNIGEIVNSMEPLASIGSSSDFIVEMLVDEVDIVKIETGQRVLITLDAYQDTVFVGSVSKILPKKDERNQTFMVEALFNKPPKTLYPGLSGEANIIIAKKENVLTIPKAYIFEDNKVKTDNGIVAIKIGLQNMEYVEVVSGIDSSTELHKPIE